MIRSRTTQGRLDETRGIGRWRSPICYARMRSHNHGVAAPVTERTRAPAAIVLFDKLPNRPHSSKLPSYPHSGSHAKAKHHFDFQLIDDPLMKWPGFGCQLVKALLERAFSSGPEENHVARGHSARFQSKPLEHV